MSNATVISPASETPTSESMDSPSAPASLKSLALKGSVWTILGFGASQALRLGGNVVAAFFLLPEHWGLMAIVNIVVMGLQMFSDIGIGPAIIQNDRGTEPRFLNTAWTMQTLRGVTLWVIACGVAWPAASFYGEPALLALLPAAAFSAIIGGFNSTSLFTLNRQLAMGRLVSVDLVSQIVSVGVMIAWAAIWQNVWALVASTLAAAFMRMVLSHAALPGIQNGFTWDWTAAKELFRFGRWIFVSTAVTFLAMQIDRIMLAKVIPMDVFGVYAIALAMLAVLRDIARRLTSSILFPVLAETKRSGSVQSLRAKARRARSLILMVSSTAICAAALFAPPFFHLLYKPAYHDAGWMAQLLCIAIWFGLLSTSIDRALLALGETRPLAISNFVKLIVTAAAGLGGVFLFGVPGFIVGMGMGALAGHIVVQWALLRHEILLVRQDIRYTAFVGAVVGLGVGLPHLLGRSDALDWLNLTISAALVAGVAVWSGVRTFRGLR